MNTKDCHNETALFKKNDITRDNFSISCLFLSVFAGYAWMEDRTGGWWAVSAAALCLLC